MNFDVITGGKLPIKAWIRGVQLEDAAKQQLLNLSNMPFIHKHVAAMPDVHWGMGATIGSVIATKGAIIPAAVGVDIGCGMMARRTTLTASDLPDNLHSLRLKLESAIPHGRTNNGGKGDRGAWHNIPGAIPSMFESLGGVLQSIFEKHPQLKKQWTQERVMSHLGTLGTGNHFVEICLDENQKV